MITPEQLLARFPTAQISAHAADGLEFKIPHVLEGRAEPAMTLSLNLVEKDYMFSVGTSYNRNGPNGLHLVRNYLHNCLDHTQRDIKSMRELEKRLHIALDTGGPL